jgi:hypothetical protein
VKVINERELVYKMEIESARRERIDNAKMSYWKAPQNDSVSDFGIKPHGSMKKDNLYDSVSDFLITKDYGSVSDFGKGTDMFEKFDIDNVLEEHIKSVLVI